MCVLRVSFSPSLNLIEKLWEENSSDNIILDIGDLVRENDVRMSVLYGVVPYIVEIAVIKDVKESKKCWMWRL